MTGDPAATRRRRFEQPRAGGWFRREDVPRTCAEASATNLLPVGVDVRLEGADRGVPAMSNPEPTTPGPDVPEGDEPKPRPADD